MIIKECKRFGIDIPFKRPRKISGDLIGDASVLLHALDKCEKFYSEKYDVVLMIQPTSPFRTKSSIDEVLKKIENQNLMLFGQFQKLIQSFIQKRF